MKKYFAAALLLLFAFSVFSQDSLKNKDYYLQKSKKQKTAALILLGGGTIMTITGVVIMTENLFTSKGTGLAVAGLLVSSQHPIVYRVREK